jgi:nucleoid DNA-binding protein
VIIPFKKEKIMEELYELVVKKTGLPKETAKMAVDVVVDFIKKKLPAPRRLVRRQEIIRLMEKPPRKGRFGFKTLIRIMETKAVFCRLLRKGD